MIGIKKTAALLLAALLLAALPTALAGPAPEREPARSQAGSDVSEFSSLLITGDPVNGEVFSEYGVSIVTYWATWSPACREQMAFLQQVHEEHPEYGVFGLLHTDATSTADAARDFMTENGYDFPVFVWDTVWKRIVNEAPYIPQSFIVTRSGIIAEAWHAAFTSVEEMEARLDYWNFVEPGSGDVNFDGTIDNQDSIITLRCALGIVEGDERVYACGDVDGDGTLDTSDALLIMRTVMGLQGE